MMAFEQFERQRHRYGQAWNDGEGISISKHGQLHVAVHILDTFFANILAVNLYYDHEARQIGMQPTNEPTHNSYEFKPSNKGICRQQRLNTSGFIAYYGLQVEHATRYPATWSDELGMLIVQLPAREDV